MAAATRADPPRSFRMYLSKAERETFFGAGQGTDLYLYHYNVILMMVFPTLVFRLPSFQFSSPSATLKKVMINKMVQ